MNVEKLAKILAMAASDNETEAVHALRTARRLLETEGADFVELARLLTHASPQNGDLNVERLQDAIFDLRNEVRHLRAENEHMKRSVRSEQVPPLTGSAGLAQAAEAAASAIRLRSQLTDVTASLESERTQNLALRNAAAAQTQMIEDMTADNTRLAARISELENRRQRMEAENRRLGNLAHALRTELSERLADRLDPPPPPPMAWPITPPVSAMPMPVPVSPFVEPRQSTRRRGNARTAADQYALF